MAENERGYAVVNIQPVGQLLVPVADLGLPGAGDGGELVDASDQTAPEQASGEQTPPEAC